MTPEIDALLDGARMDTGFPDFRASAFVDRFLAGHMLGVSLAGRSHRDVDIERLRNMDEVWALCIRNPRPGWRIFGRFIGKDCFVALLAYDRILLNTSENYARLAAETVSAWNTMFSGHGPHRGSVMGDYLGGTLRDVDV